MEDIITALATAWGEGGIAIIRVSGEGSLSLADKLFSASSQLSEYPPRHMVLGKMISASGEIFDEVLAVRFEKNKSYTGEESIEFHCHGGSVAAQKCIEELCALGARIAMPGEFTRRAFLNGKLDLAQAEAVVDLIDASTKAAARSAVRSLQGEFSKEIHALLDQLTELRALVEATLDFPEEEVDFLEAADAFGRLARLQARLAQVFDRARQGKLLQGGLHVVLAGQPNVGKSSLLNRLAGDDLAIVTPVAGTTRDVVRSTLQVDGIPLHVIDTAGLRDTDDAVEKIGIERTWREIERADVVVLLVDARIGVSDAERAILAQFPTSLTRITVYNKVDLAGRTAERHDESDGVAVSLSAKHGDGIDLLRRELLRIAGWHPTEDVFIARERHLRALTETQEHIAAAQAQLPQLELFAEELRLAQQALSSITGEFSADDLLGEIFGRFCIGK